MKYLLFPFLLIATPAAASLEFVFMNDSTAIGMALDSQNSGSVTQGGVEMTATAGPGPFNATGSFFGINQSAGGDDTDGFDFEESGGPGVAEMITISFDADVFLESIRVSSFGSSDEVTVSEGMNTIAVVSMTGMTSLGSYALSANTPFAIATTAGSYGNGWSLDSLTISTVTAVPEPTTFLPLLAVLIGTALSRRRRD